MSQPLNGNRLLSALPAEEYARLGPHLEPVSLSLSQILFRPEEQLRHAYFPTNSVVSLLTDLEDGTGMEVGLVGKEGVVGVSAFLGGSETKLATVQAGGEALRLRAETLREEFQRGGALQAALLRYAHALMVQISQSVVCNVRHGIEERLARWLLMYHDRLGADEFTLTHEFMANMLGVRRAGVSVAARKLQKLGFIRYQRGHIAILDRQGLEDFACECYPTVREKYDDFML
jgi:CRP-like cAMP-binding protein